MKDLNGRESFTLGMLLMLVLYGVWLFWPL